MANPNLIGPIGFNGGLNFQASSIGFPNNQMSFARNVNIRGNKLYRRGGNQIISGGAVSANTIYGMGHWQGPSSTSYLMLQSGTNVYSKNLTSNGAYTSLGAVNASGSVPTFASLGAYVIIASAQNGKPKRWDGTTFADLGGTAPNGNIVCSVNNFLFVSGDSGNPSRVYWSNILDPTTFTATNYIEFDKDSGNAVTALVPFQGDLLIFTSNSVGRLSTTTTVVSGSATLAPLTTITKSVGCYNWNSVDQLPDGRVAFISNNFHVWIYDGSSFADIGDPPFPYSNVQRMPTFGSVINGISISLNNFYPFRTLNYTKLISFPQLNQLWIYSGNDTNDINRPLGVLVYNYALGVWESYHTFVGSFIPTAFCRYRNYPALTPGEGLFIANGADLSVYYEDFSQDYDYVSSAITCQVSVPVYTKNSFQNVNNLSVVTEVDPCFTAGTNTYTVNYGFNGLFNVNTLTLGNTFDYTDLTGTDQTIRNVTPLFTNSKRIASVLVRIGCSSVNTSSSQIFGISPFFISDQVET